MDPQQELQQWVAFRHQLEQQYGNNLSQLDPSLIDRYNGKSLSPQAYQLYKTGNGSQHYDITQGEQGGLAKDKGWFSHPESWIQLAAGAGMGAAAAGAFAGAGSAAGVGGSGAARTAGDVGTVAGGSGSFDDAGNWVPDNGYPGSPGYAGGNSFPNGIPSGATGLASLLTDPKWSPLIKALAGVGGLLGGKALANQGQENAIPPQLNQLLDLSMQRANAQTPLFNAANKGLYDMLPTFAKKGGG